jgi:hypothetical protein
LSFYRVGSFLALNNREFYRLSNEIKKWKVVIILKMLKKLDREVPPDPRERRPTDQ